MIYPHKGLQQMLHSILLYPPKPPQTPPQTLDDLCGICDVAGRCTCADESQEQFFSDRATWLSEGSP